MNSDGRQIYASRDCRPRLRPRHSRNSPSQHLHSNSHPQLNLRRQHLHPHPKLPRYTVSTILQAQLVLISRQACPTTHPPHPLTSPTHPTPTTSIASHSRCSPRNKSPAPRSFSATISITQSATASRPVSTPRSRLSNGRSIPV